MGTKNSLFTIERDYMWWLIPLALGALLLAGLTLATVLNWFDSNKSASSVYGKLIKERLANGNYRVVGGVFNTKGHCTDTQVWEATELDDDLKKYFGQQSQVKVKL
ncbi:MAG TPA: hypothetical protein VEU33_37620 [Archangium sp.]|nr:hypothetical protein [Archangium sp.]